MRVFGTSEQIWNMTSLLTKRVSLSGGTLLGRPSGRSGPVLACWLPPREPPVLPVVPAAVAAGSGGVTTGAAVVGCGLTAIVLTICTFAGVGRLASSSGASPLFSRGGSVLSTTTGSGGTTTGSGGTTTGSGGTTTTGGGTPGSSGCTGTGGGGAGGSGSGTTGGGGGGGGRSGVGMGRATCVQGRPARQGKLGVLAVQGLGTKPGGRPAAVGNGSPAALVVSPLVVTSQ